LARNAKYDQTEYDLEDRHRYPKSGTSIQG